MNSKVIFPYDSLEDFLVSNTLSVDGQLNDGFGALFPVKGREIEAAILFTDISNFSSRSRMLSSTETLIFVNNFFTWITAEALRGIPAIIDKYIGDEIMVIFSNEFGSDNAVIDALKTARWMAQNDELNFCPHMGIARGMVTVGFVGTPFRYDCSAFGLPVTLAKRCAGIKPEETCSSSIVFPNDLWQGFSFEQIFPRRKFSTSDGGTFEKDYHTWKMCEPRKVSLKGFGEIEIREMVKKLYHFPEQSAEQKAKESAQWLKQNGYYKPLAR